MATSPGATPFKEAAPAPGAVAGDTTYRMLVMTDAPGELSLPLQPYQPLSLADLPPPMRLTPRAAPPGPAKAFGVQRPTAPAAPPPAKVRKTPCRLRSWANFSLLWLCSLRNAWADLHRLGQPNTFFARRRRTWRSSRSRCTRRGSSSSSCCWRRRSTSSTRRRKGCSTRRSSSSSRRRASSVRQAPLKGS